MIGIYKITNPNKKVYIGQSVDIEKRFISYKRLHKRNEKLIVLYRSFLKYGVDSHFFEIIELCEVEDLNERERYWQDYLNVLKQGLNCRLTKTNDKSGHMSEESKLKISNANLGNKSWLGKKHTKETKKKISIANKGRKFSDEVNLKKGRKGIISPCKGLFSKQHPKSVRVLQLDLNNNVVKEWDSLMDIKRSLGYHIGNISSCMKGKLKTYKKYKWEYNK